jgi:hypothetical protein
LHELDVLIGDSGHKGLELGGGLSLQLGLVGEKVCDVSVGEAELISDFVEGYAGLRLGVTEGEM